MTRNHPDETEHFHVHDRRECWRCGGLGIVHRSISLKLTEKTLRTIGWRFLEPGGRMVCPSCWWDMNPRLPLE